MSSLASQFALGSPISTFGFLEIGTLPLTLDGKWFAHWAIVLTPHIREPEEMAQVECILLLQRTPWFLSPIWVSHNHSEHQLLGDLMPLALMDTCAHVPTLKHMNIQVI